MQTPRTGEVPLPVEAEAQERAPEQTHRGMGPQDVVRAATAVVGGVLVGTGLRRRSIGGTLLALAGGELLRQAATGQSLVGAGLRQVAKRKEAGAPAEAPEFVRAVTIQKPADELYRLWREPETQRLIMADFAEVTASDTHAHWSLRTPMERIEWDTQIVEERPGEFLRWESVPGSVVPIEGTVQFRPAPADRGTEVHLRLRFSVPGGAVGMKAAKLTGIVPRTLELKALRNFKCLAETGEITTNKGQPACRPGGRYE